MNRFQRGIINGFTIMVTLIAITLDWLTGTEIPIGAWFVWMLMVATWTLYDSYENSLENKRIRAQIDRTIEALLKGKTSCAEENIVGGRTIYTHTQDVCEGQACCIHNPSNHHMRDWVQRWRDDRGLMERVCVHDVGHPDPDDVEWHRSTGRGYVSVHGCDGCCKAMAI